MRIASLLPLLLWSAAAFARDSKCDLLVAQLEAVTLHIDVRPFAFRSPDDQGGGLRSVLLYVSHTLLVEPDSKWPDGTRATASARIPNESMLRILDAFDRRAFFSAAETYYSERDAKPEGSPPAKEHVTAELARGWNSRSAEIRLDFFEHDYYTDYFIALSWRDQLPSLLAELRTITVGTDAQPLVADLLKTYERFK